MVQYHGKLLYSTMVHYDTIPWYCTMDYFSYLCNFLSKIFTPIHFPPFQASVAEPWGQQLNTSVVLLTCEPHSVLLIFCTIEKMHDIDVWTKVIKVTVSGIL